MKLSPLLVLTGLFCWFLFVLGTAAGFVSGVGALVLSLVPTRYSKRLQRYASDNIHAADCAAAAFFGWSGDNTISKECGIELNGDPCAFCNYLCKALDHVDEGHCKREGEKVS